MDDNREDRLDPFADSFAFALPFILLFLDALMLTARGPRRGGGEDQDGKDAMSMAAGQKVFPHPTHK
jgi:hypothetical protein